MAKQKLTNKEVLTQIASMGDVEANTYGVSADMRNMAARAAGGDESAKAAFYAPYTPLYNAFCGFVVKFAMTALSKAFYYDVYGPHHRNMLQGRPELGFVKKATAGTGNHSKQFAANPAQGSLTTVVTADMPDVVALYDITVASYEARIPVSTEDVKTAFTTEYGINDLYTKVRESLEDKITEDRNVSYDTKLAAVAAALIPAGTGSEINANAGKATYVTVAPGADWSTIVTNKTYGSLTEDQLTQVFVQIKKLYYGMTTRPNTRYNALGVANNAPKDMMICYLDADLYAEMSRVKASVFDASALEESGLRIVPLAAPWLGTVIDSKPIIAAIGTADFIRDWPTSDFGSSVPTDRGAIESRFMDTQIAVCGYEPFTFIVGDTSYVPPTPAAKTFSIASVEISESITTGGGAIAMYAVIDGVIDSITTSDVPVTASGLMITVPDLSVYGLMGDTTVTITSGGSTIKTQTFTSGLSGDVILSESDVEDITDSIAVVIDYAEV